MIKGNELIKIAMLFAANKTKHSSAALAENLSEIGKKKYLLIMSYMRNSHKY
jgi:hypothetical protein